MRYIKFNAFMKTVVANIKDWLPEVYQGASVEIHKFNKNNGITLHGMLIKVPWIDISPVIYLEEFYEMYTQGRYSLDDILKKIAALYVENNVLKGWSKEDVIINQWEDVKDLIGMRLINAAWNNAMLQSMPFSQYEDLAIVYYIDYGKKFENAKALITNKMINKWGVSVKDLHNQAVENGKRDVEFKPILQVLSDAGIPLRGGGEEVNMYVLSNKSRLYGACACLYPGILHDIYCKIGNFITLPSSIHELLIVGCEKDDIEKKAILYDLVNEVNTNQVAFVEQLSYSIYEYDVEKDRLVKVELK